MVAPGSDYGIAMWSDIKQVENAVFLDYVIDTGNRILNILHHIHFSFVINSKIQLPFQNLWKKYYSLENVGLSPSEQACIIFTDISACRTDTEYLRFLHDKDNITMVMVLVNVMSSKLNLISNRLTYFDQIYSFDRIDCEKYGFDYYPSLYSITKLTDDASVSSDAFFVGVSKGNRHELLKELYKVIRLNGGKPVFYVNGFNNKKDRQKGINYNRWLNYNDVLKHVVSTNCVIEIMGPGQSGLTLRSMEAIVFNKKLLSNNESIKSLRFYESGYIKYFEDIDDIDVEFILNKEVVDYHYNGEFSPINLLETINQQCE